MRTDEGKFQGNLMRPIGYATLLALILPCGCMREDPVPAPAVNTPPPVTSGEINSPDRLTAALENRWTLERIRRYAIPERRLWEGCQNLVAGFPSEKCDSTLVWEGELFNGITTGFDEIAWYANTCGNHVEEYSLGVTRGDDFWLLEIASPTDLDKPPVVEPPWDDQCFAGGDHSMYK
jgi:hypothetical protein